MEDEYRELLEALAENVLDFEDLYGFKHDCHCAEDWEEGNVGMVSECYRDMVNDALEHCYNQKGKIAELERHLDILRMQVAEHNDEPRV